MIVGITLQIGQMEYIAFCEMSEVSRIDLEQYMVDSLHRGVDQNTVIFENIVCIRAERLSQPQNTSQEGE